MEYEFLNNFNERMKRVGAYALLYKNSMQKTTWKKFGFENFDEQTNIIFAVLLYVMEQSLKDEPCTLDDIGSFVDDLNMSYLKKTLTYEDCKELADFIVNTVLCDDGSAMYFNGYDFSEKEYQAINISFLNNEIIYLEDTVRRTSFKLSNDGYSLLLSTLEMEANMRLTIHEFIFKMHLDKQSYDKAVEDVKNIFNLIRIQLQKMQEAVLKIKQNALSYSVQEYKNLMNENLTSLETTKNKFDSYKNHVRERIVEFEEQDINIKKLEKEELDNLNYLKIIEMYLSLAIEEQQKLLMAHFDLKDVYAKELEDLSQMSLIKRFSIRKDLYELVFEDAGKLEDIHYFLAPLFRKKIRKKYNINKAIQYQKTIRKKEAEDNVEMLSFDEDEWEAEQMRLRKEKLDKYKHSLQVMLRLANKRGEISLHEISAIASEDRALLKKLIPTIEIFREIVIELLKIKSVDVQELREEKAQYTDDLAPQFQLNETVLNIVEESPDLGDIAHVRVSKLSGKEKVKFRELSSKDGMVKVVTCSDILFEVKRGKKHGI